MAAAAASLQQLRVLCRLCLQESNELDDIFGAGSESGSTLHMRIMASVSLEIHRSDNLPKGICPACRYQLEKTYIFRSRCRNNDTRLRRHVKLLSAGKVSRMLEELDEDEDDEFQPSLEYIKQVDEREKEQEKIRWDEKVATFEEEFRAVAELQRKTVYSEVRNELLSKKYDDKVEVGTMTDGGEVVQIIPVEMEDVPDAGSQPKPLEIKITDCYSVAESSTNSCKKKLRNKIHAKLAKQDEELIQYLEEERLISENDESMEVLDEAVTNSITADQFIITEVSDSETYIVDTDDRLNEQDLYNSDSDSDEDLEAVTNAVKAELAERPNLAVDENCVMKVEKTRDLTKVEVRATDGSLICMEFSRERSTPSPTPDNTYHVKLGGHEYVCPNCPLTFKNARSLGIHVCLAKDAKRYPCDVCQKVHPTKQALKRHYRIHTGEKPFSCPLCDRAFVQKEVLKRHMLTHSGHRPHGCDHCQRRFNQKDQLRHHINRCHAENPVLTLHECHICHKTFKHMSGLSRHTATHYGRTYPCETCSKVFNDKSALKRHEVALHGQRWKKGATDPTTTTTTTTAETTTTATKAAVAQKD